MTFRRLFVFLASFIFSGCWFSSHPVAMPENDSEFSRPGQKPFSFSTPRKFTWNFVSSDSPRRGQVVPFDMNKLPAQPFNPGAMVPLLKPANEAAFHYGSLPDTLLNLDAIPSEPVVYKTSLLGKIKKTTLGQPRLRAESFYTSFQYNDDQGLPGQAVQSVLHTRDGLAWVLTNQGLAIINGESLENIPTNYGDGFFMAEDTLGQIWIRSIGRGIFIIDRKTGIQKQIANFPPGIHLQIDRKGAIWITTFSEGVYVISPDQKTWKHLTVKNGLSSNHIEFSFQDNEGRIWIGTDDMGVDILDWNLKKIKRLRSVQGLSTKQVFCIAENKAGDIYIAGHHRGMEIINIKNETYKHLDSAQGIARHDIFDMKEDDEGRMWAITDSIGVYILGRQADSLSLIGVSEGLGEGNILCLDKDDRHQMFVGTIGGGLNVFPPVKEIAHHLTTKEGLISDNIWNLLEDNKHRIWLSSYDGANIITPGDHKIYKLLLNTDTEQPGSNVNRRNRIDCILQTGPDQFAICGNQCGFLLIDESRHTLEKVDLNYGAARPHMRLLYHDSKGLIWILTSDAGLMVYDPEKRTVRRLNHESGLASDNLTGIIEYSNGHFLISTYGGINSLNLVENTIAVYSVREGLSSDITMTIFKDSRKRIWIPTEKGLNLLDTVKKTNTIFTIANGMPSNGIYSMLERGGRIYAGTAKGLTVLKETEKEGPGMTEPSWILKTYGRSLGFSVLDFNANSAHFFSSGQFWWGLVPGITLLDSAVFQSDSSLEPVEVTGIDILGKPQYFTDPGLIDRVDSVWNENKDSFYLKGSFGDLNTDKQKGIEWKSLSSINMPVGFSLPPDRNYLRFHFGNFLPQSEGIYKYQYILDGVDETWNIVTDQPVSENYNNISPGYYTFRVAVKKGFGPWSEPSQFHFRIRPPWWQSWWAELIYLLVFIGLIRIWVRYRSSRLHQENVVLEQKVKERTAELSTSLENLRQTQGQLIQAEKMASLGELTAGIAHEIQNPLNFVNNFSEVNTELIDEVNKALDLEDISEAKELLRDVEMNMGKITFHGKRADTIVKGMLLHSRANSGQKIPTNINALADEYLRLSYHGLRAKDKSFNAMFTMNLDEKIAEILLVPQDIGRVFLNLFNNAFYAVTEKKKLNLQGYEPTVSVQTIWRNETVEIRIRDNGSGIPKKVLEKIYQPFFTTKPAGQGTGLGLSLSYDIITKEHGGKIDVVTKENEYTEFIIELPFQA